MAELIYLSQWLMIWHCRDRSWYVTLSGDQRSEHFIMPIYNLASANIRYIGTLSQACVDIHIGILAISYRQSIPVPILPMRMCKVPLTWEWLHYNRYHYPIFQKELIYRLFQYIGYPICHPYFRVRKHWINLECIISAYSTKGLKLHSMTSISYRPMTYFIFYPQLLWKTWMYIYELLAWNSTLFKPLHP